MRRFCFVCFMLLSVNAFAQGPILWEVEQDFDGGQDTIRAIGLSRRTAVVVGNAGADSGGLDFVNQAVSRATGAVRWTDRVASSPGLSTDVHLASTREHIFTAGYGPGSTPDTTDILVRAYSAETGSLVWTDVWDAGRDDFPQSIVAGPSAVVVVGSGGNTLSDPLALLVRAYDPADGGLLWEDEVRGDAGDTVAWGVSANRRHVFVAGTTTSPLFPNQRDLLLRAYDAVSGTLEWELQNPATSPIGIAVKAGRVLVSGSVASPLGPPDTYLAAFEASTGALLWQDVAPVSGIFTDIAIRGTRLVAVGAAGKELLVRAYDVQSGVMTWEDRPILPPGMSELATAVDLSDSGVYVVGTSGQDFVYSELLVRAYEATTGLLLWDDRSHRSRAGAAAVDVVVGKKRLFVAGSAMGSNSTSNFVIRAYDVRGDGIVRLPEDDHD